MTMDRAMMQTPGCTSGLGSLGRRTKVYTVCVWQRVLTSTEIAQIELAPYVMFGEGLPGTGARRRWIIQSMFSENLILIILAISIYSTIGIIVGVCDMIRREHKIRQLKKI
jgi:hypothetical protein